MVYQFFKGDKAAPAAEPRVVSPVATMGHIGQQFFAGGSMGDFQEARFHDQMTGNHGQYSTPGGVGHDMGSEPVRTVLNVFHATPQHAAPVNATSHDFDPFGGGGQQQGALLAPPAGHVFRQTVHHQPRKKHLTGGA
jgi:hypothetical protein